MGMVKIVRIIITTTTLLSGMFALGGVSILYMKYQTRVLKLISLFISSLLLISFNFWSGVVFNANYVIPEIVSFLGCILCIAVLPYLATTLISKKLSTTIERIIWGWNLVYIGLGISYYIYQFNIYVMASVAYMLILTIAVWAVYLAINIKDINNKLLKKSLKVFVYLSLVFLVLLILDFLITTLPINQLEIFDNFSLAFYFLALNIGAFFFAGGFLNREAYMVNGKLTPSFLDNFKLTPREGEIIEKAYLGKTNKEIGDELYISPKTVENHLSNIYQKMQVKNKKMLILELNTWQSS